MNGDALVREARRWIGTPFRHQASLRGVGCDCLGLVVGVLRACGETIEDPPPYEPMFTAARRDEILIAGLDAHLTRIPDASIEPGAILAFRWREVQPASHLAFATGDGSMIHAHSAATVAEVPLGNAFLRRLAAVYRA